jgi:RNA polymerase sigma-70 factor, ECF subfamily
MDRDDVLVAAAQQGDLHAFNQLVIEYQALAYNVAYRILGDTDSAADATQDSFLKAYRSINNYRGGSFRAWLLRVLTNTCYDQLRARRRRPARSLDDGDGVAEWATFLEDPGERPADHAERRELGQLIQRAIRALPLDQRTVVLLADVEGLSYEEIAAATGMPIGTVKSRLSRARAHLRDFLLGHKELLPNHYCGLAAGVN